MQELKKSSIGGLAAGSSLALAVVIPQGLRMIPAAATFPIHSTIMFSTFQMSKIFLGVDLNSTSLSPSDLVKVAAAAALGETIAVMHAFPMEIGVEQGDGQRIDRNRGARISQGVKKHWKLYGLTGFYIGSTVRLARCVPSASILFTLYHYARSQYEPEKSRGMLSNLFIRGAVCGAAAGAVTGFMITPLFNAEKAIGPDMSHGNLIGVKKELSLFWANLSTRSQGGIRKLYRGALLYALNTAFSSLILFGVYELVSQKV